MKKQRAGNLILHRPYGTSGVSHQGARVSNAGDSQRSVSTRSGPENSRAPRGPRGPFPL